MMLRFSLALQIVSTGVFPLVSARSFLSFLSLFIYFFLISSPRVRS